jgi:transcriptional regulator with XRE-family HTH domain
MSTLSHHKDYLSGSYGLPHMGKVIADHRIKAGWTSQESFAIVCGVDKQTVAYWENQEYFTDMDRRIFLCKLLKIPPLLLGLTWLSVTDEANSDTLTNTLGTRRELLEENAYGLYEDILAFSYTSSYDYSPETSYRFFKHQQELEQLVIRAPGIEQNAWSDLLSRFYQRSTFIALHQKREEEALSLAKKAVSLAEPLQDPELLGAALYRRSRIHLTQNSPDVARVDVESALDQVKKARVPLKGSCYLLAAEINALYAGGDEALKTQCRTWQENAAKLVYGKKLEDDGTFFRLNLYAVNHERAKTLIRFALFHTNDNELVECLKQTYIRADKELLTEARSAINAARKYLNPTLDTNQVDLSITEAKCYLVMREYEQSAQTAKLALQFARQSLSKQRIEEIKKLYALLSQLAPTNPYIANLGVELNIFPQVIVH